MGLYTRNVSSFADAEWASADRLSAVYRNGRRDTDVGFEFDAVDPIVRSFVRSFVSCITTIIDGNPCTFRAMGNAASQSRIAKKCGTTFTHISLDKAVISIFVLVISDEPNHNIWMKRFNNNMLCYIQHDYNKPVYQTTKTHFF